MKKILLLAVLSVICSAIHGQYWFGPKLGINYITPIYQDNTVKETYEIENDLDFNAGVAFNYSATDMYSVYAELVYERMNRNLRSTDPDGNVLVSSQVTNDFLTLPVMLRISFGKVPFHYYINGGPKVSYWLSSKGSLLLPSFAEAVILDPETGQALEEPQPLDYRVTFNSGKDNGEDVLLLSKPNRLQFGLTFGGGVWFDLVTGARLMLDFRYTFGHSNFGIDDPDDSWFDYEQDDNYIESFEYSLNTISISVGYLWGYNSQLKRRGRSTNSESNKRKKK